MNASHNAQHDQHHPFDTPPGRSVGRAFTLLEVLVVIGILSLLIAMLIPALAESRAAAKSLQCKNNLRQIAIAWHLYLDAHDDHFYQDINANVIYGGKTTRIPSFRKPRPLNPFLDLPEMVDEAPVFHCPTDTGGPRVEPTHYDHYGTSYATNRWLIGQDQVEPPEADPCHDVLDKMNEHLRKLRRADVYQEGKLILAGDFGWTYEVNPLDDKKAEWHRKPCGFNIAFLDGHVDFVKMRKGLYVTSQYHVIPFEQLIPEAIACQEEVDCE